MLPPPKSFVSRRGAFGGYEVTGWRYAEDTAWHVKAGRPSRHQDAKTYVVMDGTFDFEPAVASEKIAILSLIAQWEAGLPDTVADFPDLNNPSDA
jgi:hypothetical protein